MILTNKELAEAIDLILKALDHNSSQKELLEQHLNSLLEEQLNRAKTVVNKPITVPYTTPMYPTIPAYPTTPQWPNTQPYIIYSTNKVEFE